MCSFDMLYENIYNIFYEILKIMGPIRLEIYHLKLDECKILVSFYHVCLHGLSKDNINSTKIHQTLIIDFVWSLRTLN